jgi:hypothetical protein
MRFVRVFPENGRYEEQEPKAMINPVSSASVVTPTVQSARQPKPQRAAPTEPKDTVHLSSQAKAQASGDVDHDGDSH